MNSTPHTPVRITGERHQREDGRECFCGCRHVVDLPGTVIEECSELRLVIAEFWVDHGTGAGKYVKVAYNI